MTADDHMTTIGFIGSGNIGSTVARLAVAAGHHAVLSSSRGPDAREAAAAGDVVVVTVPLAAHRRVPVEELAGKVVIDTDNYYPERAGAIAELDDETTTTSELLAQHLPSSHVVKAFDNIFFENLAELARPSGSPERSALPIAGEDAGARAAVTALLDDLGYDAHDVGALAEGWRFRRDTRAYVHPHADTAHGMASRQATAQDLAPLLAAAQRYRDTA